MLPSCYACKLDTMMLAFLDEYWGKIEYENHSIKDKLFILVRGKESTKDKCYELAYFLQCWFEDYLSKVNTQPEPLKDLLNKFSKGVQWYTVASKLYEKAENC
jgi:hypothetical protein